MKHTHLVRLVYIDQSGNREPEEEIVLVDAETIEEAAYMSMKKNTIVAGGRLVEKYDEAGNRIYA